MVRYGGMIPTYCPRCRRVRVAERCGFRRAKRRSRTIENDLRGRLGHGSLSLAENGDLLGERVSSFGAAQELFDGEVNLREELAGIVRAVQPLDVNELVAIPTRPTRDRDSAPVYPPKTPAKC